MTAPDVQDPGHFTRIVTEYGEHRPVVTKQAIFNTQGVKIIEQGTAIRQGLYERLMAHRLETPIEQSLRTEGGVTGRQVREGIEALLEKVPLMARMAPPGSERQRTLDVIEKLALPEPIAFQLSLMRDLRPGLYQHSLQAAWTMAWLVGSPLGSRFDVGMAAAAGLLHDLGMLHLDPVLLDPGRELNRDQRRQLDTHPLIGTALLERHHAYPSEVLRAIREHHECLDGSGYPASLGAESIGPLGRCLSLAEVVAALIGPGEAASELKLSVLLRMNRSRYDRELTVRVMELLQPGLDPETLRLPPMAAPQARLTEIDRLISDWPRDVHSFEDSNPEREAGMRSITGLVDQFRRTLAEAGLAPAQLEQLGDAGDDPLMQIELSLLAREAAWQLRALARQARRRWRAGAQGLYPPMLQSWSERADALSRAVMGGEPPLAAG